MSGQLATVAVIVVAYAVVSRRLHGSIITLPMFFVTAGLIAGSDGLKLIDLPIRSEVMRVLAEGTLTLILFADASRIDLVSLTREYMLPVRLLGIGLPLTIVAGAAVGAGLFGGLAFPELLLIAVILAPTDAALGQAVIADRRLPSRIRQGLNVESGLNDGLCVPLLLIAIALIETDVGARTAASAWGLVIEEIGWGIVAGLAAGMVTSFAARKGRQLGWIDPGWLRILPVAGAALSYGIASALDGSGFIAAFVGGLVFGVWRPRGERVFTQFIDETGELLNALTFLMFGAVVVGPFLSHLTWQLVLYSLLSLTAIRMIPVAISLIGSRAHPWTVAYLGWFGPRGLASIVFATILVSELRGSDVDLLLASAVLTVTLSVYLHGLTAVPATNRYVRWYEPIEEGALAMEDVAVPEPRWRRQGFAGDYGEHPRDI
jgi:NhaP-type Na+/H+ or K+/H+ antiporter